MLLVAQPVIREGNASQARQVLDSLLTLKCPRIRASALRGSRAEKGERRNEVDPAIWNQRL